MTPELDVPRRNRLPNRVHHTKGVSRRTMLLQRKRGRRQRRLLQKGPNQRKQRTDLHQGRLEEMSPWQSVQPHITISEVKGIETRILCLTFSQRLRRQLRRNRSHMMTCLTRQHLTSTELAANMPNLAEKRLTFQRLVLTVLLVSVKRPLPDPRRTRRVRLTLLQIPTDGIVPVQN